MWCPIRVDAVLEGLPGVYGSIVDVDAGTVTVRYDASRVTPGAIARRIDSSGSYQASRPSLIRRVSRGGS